MTAAVNVRRAVQGHRRLRDEHRVPRETKGRGSELPINPVFFFKSTETAHSFNPWDTYRVPGPT